MLFAAWRARLEAVRAGLLSAQGDARAGTRVDGEHRPANRGERGAVTTQGYLAAGIGERLAALDGALELLDRMPADPRHKAVTGAQITLEDEGGEVVELAILPGGDGTEVEGVRVVSPEAPIAKAIWGREEDEEARIVRGGQATDWVLVAVR